MIIIVEMMMIQKLMHKITYQCIQRNSGQNGGFHDQNPVKGKKGLIPLKTSDTRFLNTERYGGYNGDTAAYAFLVEHYKGKKQVRTIEFISVCQKAKYEMMENGLEKYCEEMLGLSKPRILIKKILFNSIIKTEGFPICISGGSGNDFVGKIPIQLILSCEEEKILKAAHKINERLKEQKNASFVITKEYDNINYEDALLMYDVLLNKLNTNIYLNRPATQNKVLERGKEVFEKLTLAEQCQTLCQILLLFKGTGQANLTSINGTSNGGKIQKTRNITKESFLITTSITGFFTSVINLQEL